MGRSSTPRSWTPSRAGLKYALPRAGGRADWPRAQRHDKRQVEGQLEGRGSSMLLVGITPRHPPKTMVQRPELNPRRSHTEIFQTPALAQQG
jgi:hypothetical protein